MVEPEESKSPLKHPVQRPPKSFDQMEKEYVANLEALIDMDEADWLEAVNLLEMAHTEEVLNQEEQRTLAIIDDYYESLREEHARREASSDAERRAERQRAAFFADSIHRWNELCKLNESKYMVEIEEQTQHHCASINTWLMSAGNPMFSMDPAYQTPIILDLGANKSLMSDSSHPSIPGPYILPENI